MAPLEILPCRSRPHQRDDALNEGDGFGIIAIERDVPPRPKHTAFAALQREAVNRLYTTAPANGGRDGSAPGLRPECHPGNCVAFVSGPGRHRIEAGTRDRAGQGR